MYNFCTITSSNFLVSTLTLLKSIDRKKVFILCLDDKSYKFLKDRINNNFIKLVSISSIDEFFSIKKISENRTKIELIFTLKSIFINFLLEKKIKKNDYLIYSDSDIFFFNVNFLLKNIIKQKSIYLTPHNFSKKNKFRIAYGKFNAGFLAFKNDAFSIKACKWWMKKCIFSCEFNFKKKKCGDQTYLNSFPKLFKKVKIIENKGSNLGPWNLSNYKIFFKKKNFFVDEDLLLFYHFHNFKLLTKNIFSYGLLDYKVKIDKNINKIYEKYFISYLKNYYLCEKKNRITYLKKIKILIKGFAKNDISIQ